MKDSKPDRRQGDFTETVSRSASSQTESSVRRRVAGLSVRPTDLTPDILRSSELTTGFRRAGRAVSMLSTHPKLQLLPQHTRTTSRSTALRPSSSHARLRSLHLPGLVSALPTIEASMRVHRCATPATVAGHEVATPIPRQPTQQDLQIAQSLLKSRKTRSVVLERSGNEHACPMLPTRPEHAEFGLLPRKPPAGEVATDSATKETSTDSATKKTPSSPIEIDFLAAQMLPKLVPSIKVGANVKIVDTTASMSRRRSLPLQPTNHTAGDVDEKPVQGTGRTFSTLRNHSLPSLSFTKRLPSRPLDLDPPSARREASPERVVMDRDGQLFCRVSTAETDSLAESAVSGFVLLPTPSDDGEDSSSSSSSEEQDDPRTGTIHCATLRPVSRSSSASFLVPAASVTPPPAQHAPTHSVDSLSSPSSRSNSTDSFTPSLTFPDRLSFGGE